MSNKVENPGTTPYWRNKNTLHCSRGALDLDTLAFYCNRHGIYYQAFVTDCTLWYQDKYGKRVTLPEHHQDAYKAKLNREVMQEMMAE